MPTRAMEEIFRLMLRKRMLLFLALALFTAVLPACARQSETWQRIQQAGVLRVGLDPTYPPFEVTDGTAVYRPGR